MPHAQIRTMGLMLCLLAGSDAAAQSDDYANWPPLKSTFPSTGGGGIMIKGYDPVISKGKCVTTFMAVESGENPAIYPSLIEFEAVATAIDETGAPGTNA